MDATMMETDRHDPKAEYEHSEHPSPSQMEEVCPICHISVGAETPDHVVESWASLPCGHRFGCHCLKSWLGMAEPPACPMCRQDMAHICGHPYLPRPVVVTSPRPSGGGGTHVEDPLAKQADGDHTTQSGMGGAADGAQDSHGLRRRSRRLMAKEAAATAAAAAAATAGRVATTAGPAVPVASAPIAIPSSSTYQRPSTPTPSFLSPSSSPDSSSSSASSPVFSSSSVSSGSVPASPLSALSIHVAASSSAEAKEATKTGVATSPARPLSLEMLFPRAPPMDAACTYCFGFLEKQYKEELHAEEAAAAAAEKAREAVAMTVEVIIPDAPADNDDANTATDAVDGSGALSDNENEDEDDDEASDEDEDDSNIILMSCSRKDRIVQMALGVFASGCADPSRLSSEERRKVAAHWERWRISHGKVFSAWWAAQAPHTEPAIERRTQGWVH